MPAFQRKVDVDKELLARKIEHESNESEVKRTLPLSQVSWEVDALIGNLFAVEVGGIPTTNSPEFDKFLKTDPNIYDKLMSHEVAKYTDGYSALELVKVRGRFAYQQVSVVNAESEAGFLTEVTVTSADPIVVGGHRLYDSTRYWLDDDGKVWTEKKVLDSRYRPFESDRTFPKDKAYLDARYGSATAKPMPGLTRIPVVVETPYINARTPSELTETHVLILHRAQLALATRLGVSKYSFAINKDRLRTSGPGYASLTTALSSNSETMNSAIEYQAGGGVVTDVMFPISTQPDYNALLQAQDGALKQIYDLLKVPNYSSTSNGVTNKQNTEIATGVLNKFQLVDVVRKKRERYWVEVVEIWHELTGTPKPAGEITASVVSKDLSDIAALQNPLAGSGNGAESPRGFADNAASGTLTTDNLSKKNGGTK